MMPATVSRGNLPGASSNHLLLPQSTYEKDPAKVAPLRLYPSWNLNTDTLSPEPTQPPPSLGNVFIAPGELG